MAELAREHFIPTVLIVEWRAKLGGMDASMIKRLTDLEAENARLKKMYAEERIKADLFTSVSTSQVIMISSLLAK